MAQDETVQVNEISILARRNINDSVFTNLFKDTEYTLQLYKALHPEDADVTKDEITIVTLENILLNQPYNDLGFTVGNRLLILVEAQTTWSVNIVVRGLLYMAQTIQNHIQETKQNIYGGRKVSFPEPEFYVIYTGGRKERPAHLTLSDEFFGGRRSALEVTVHVLYDGKQGDIISQYIAFTKVYQEQIGKYGKTQKAVLETIRICKDKNVLKAYLESREKEVVDIMMALFNKEQVLEAYVEEERQAAAKSAAKAATIKNAKDTALNLHSMGMDEDFIAKAVNVSVELVKQWLGLVTV